MTHDCDSYTTILGSFTKQVLDPRNIKYFFQVCHDCTNYYSFQYKFIENLKQYSVFIFYKSFCFVCMDGLHIHLIVDAGKTNMLRWTKVCTETFSGPSIVQNLTQEPGFPWISSPGLFLGFVDLSKVKNDNWQRELFSIHCPGKLLTPQYEYIILYCIDLSGKIYGYINHIFSIL